MNYFLKKRKWMAWLVLLTFLFTSFMPTNLLAGNSIAEAADSSTEDEQLLSGVYNKKPVTENGLTVSKTAKQIGLDTYQITVSLSGGGSVLERKPMEIVLALDSSSSMNQSVKVTQSVKCGAPIERAEYTKMTPKYGNGYWVGLSYKRSVTETETKTVEYRCTGSDKHLHSKYVATRSRTGTQTYYALQFEWENDNNFTDWSQWNWNVPEVNVEGQTCEEEVQGSGTSSSTRIKNAKSAMEKFINELYTSNVDAKIRIIHFAGNSEELTSDWVYLMKEQDGILVGNEKGKDELLSLIKNSWNPLTGDSNTDNGKYIYGETSGTNVQQALIHANSLFTSDSDAYQNLLLVSDGGPTVYNFNNTVGYWCTKHTDYCSDAAKAATTTAKNIREEHGNNFSLYAIAVDIKSGSNAANFFREYNEKNSEPKGIASAGCAIAASSDELSGKFKEIVSKLLRLVNNGVVTDPMGSDVDLQYKQQVDGSIEGIAITPTTIYDEKGVALPDKDQPHIQINTVNGISTLEWYTGAYLKQDEEYTLTYQVKLNNISKPNQYVDLNGVTFIQFTDKDGGTQRVDFDEPKIVYQVGTLSVTASGLPESTIINEQNEGPEIVGRTTEEDLKLDNKFSKIKTSAEVVGTVPEGYELKYVNVTQSGTTTKMSIAEFEDWYNRNNHNGVNGVIDVVKGETKIEYVYGKDETQTHSVSYQVKYYKDGVLADTDKEVKAESWIGEETKVNVDKTAINTSDKYVGYSCTTEASSIPESYSIAAGTATGAVNEINVYYVKDENRKHSVSYQVKYYKDGVLADTDKEVKAESWIGEETKVNVDKTAINTSDKYVGYSCTTEASSIPESYSIAAGTVTGAVNEINVYYISNGDTAYTVEYYYQQPTGDYKLEATDNRTGTTDALATLLSSDKQVNITTSSAYSWNAEDTVDNQPISGDGNTTLKVYFDLGYQVVYFYRASEENEYTQLESSGYIYQENNRILKPNVLFDGQWVTSSSALAWDFDNFTVNGHKNLFTDAFHTLYLYATGMVAPKDKGNINVTKQVAGNNTAQDYEFTLELTPEQVKGDRELTSDEIETLQHWNAEVGRKESALNNAVAALTNSATGQTVEEEFMASAVVVTTDSALKFARVDEDGTIYGLFDGDVTSPSALLYEMENQVTPDADLMQEIADFVKALSSEVISDVATLFDAVKAEFSEYVSEYVEEGSSLLFDYEKAQTMVEKLMAVTTAQEAYDQAVADRKAFTASTQITNPAEVTLVAKYQDDTTQEFLLNKDSSDTNCYYDAQTGKYIFKFTINASATQEGWMSLDVKVASGSSIQFVLKETGNGGADSTTVNGDAYTTDGLSGEVTSGSQISYVFKNTFKTSDSGNGDSGNTGKEEIPKDPDEEIDEPEVPKTEPTEEPTEEPIVEPEVPLIDVPGETIEEPEVPLGDAPKTGDSSNAVPFVVLMMVAVAGLMVTRRKFN